MIWNIIYEEKIYKIYNLNMKNMNDNCGNCGNWTCFWVFKDHKKGSCKNYKITTTDQGWCKTHTEYTDGKD